MKAFFFLLFACLSCNLWAKTDLHFTYTYTAPNGRNFNLELYEISKHFENKNFTRFTAFPSGNIPLVHADEVMYSTQHSGTIFIKTDLVAPKNLQYKIVEGEGVYLYHTNNASIAFFDFNREEVIALTKDLKKDLVSKINFLNMFIDTAQAKDESEVCQQEAKNAFNSFEMINNKLSYSLLLKKLGECGVHAMKGAEGQVESTIAFFNKLKNNPAKLWAEMKESYNHLKHFITNLASELKSFYSMVSGLSVDDQLEIACKMVGEAAPGLLMTATGVGVAAGTAKLIATLLPKMHRLKRLMTVLKSRGQNISVAKETLSCAI